jgi:sulfide dehydrogenase cytochrome subunit
MPPKGQDNLKGRFMKTARILLLIGLSITLTSTAHAQRRGKGPELNGAMLAQSCMACHGPMGASVAGPMPVIGGQPESYLANAMKAFRDGTRPSTVMGRLAKGYTDAEVSAMAKYLSALPYVRRDQKIDPALAEKGRMPYGKSCKRCHAENGRESTEPDYPILAGQWLESMQIAIADIRAGRRKVDDKFLAKLDELTPAEVDAVLHFFAAQK